MKRLAASRARIARVRRVQHSHAAAAASAAQGAVASLETSVDRLGAMRSGLLQSSGTSSGMTLAGVHELASRLDHARASLADAIVGARATAAARTDARDEARRRHESADKLDARAAAALARHAERRLRGLGRRTLRREGDIE